jgi:hypothetical protein
MMCSLWAGANLVKTLVASMASLSSASGLDAAGLLVLAVDDPGVSVCIPGGHRGLRADDKTFQPLATPSADGG